MSKVVASFPCAAPMCCAKVSAVLRAHQGTLIVGRRKIASKASMLSAKHVYHRPGFPLFNDFMKQLQKNIKADLCPPESIMWFFEPHGVQHQTIPFTFALVALCEALTCLKKKTYGSLLHFTEQAGKRIPIYQFFNYCYHVQVQRAMHPARCTQQVEARKYKVPKDFLEETPDSRSTLLAVCERAAKDMKIEFGLADTKASAEEAARGLGVHPTSFADQCHFK